MPANMPVISGLKRLRQENSKIIPSYLARYFLKTLNWMSTGSLEAGAEAVTSHRMRLGLSFPSQSRAEKERFL